MTFIQCPCEFTSLHKKFYFVEQLCLKIVLFKLKLLIKITTKKASKVSPSVAGIPEDHKET